MVSVLQKSYPESFIRKVCDDEWIMDVSDSADYGKACGNGEFIPVSCGADRRGSAGPCLVVQPAVRKIVGENGWFGRQCVCD